MSAGSVPVKVFGVWVPDGMEVGAEVIVAVFESIEVVLEVVVPFAREGTEVIQQSEVRESSIGSYLGRSRA